MRKNVLYVAMVIVAMTLGTVNAGLIAHYTFDTVDAGTTPDAIGSNYATLGARVAINTTGAKVGGGALEMLGGDDTSGPGNGAISSNTFAWDSSQTTTMVFWVKSTGARTTQGTFAAIGTNNTYGSRIEVKERSVGGALANPFYVEFNGMETSVTNPANFEDGNWHFVVVVAPQGGFASDAGLYVDGSANLNTGSPDTTHMIATYTGNLVFGDSVIPAAVTGAKDRTPNAMIDDFQLYNTALSSEQIAYLYANPGATVPEPATLSLLALGGLSLLRRRNK